MLDQFVFIQMWGGVDSKTLPRMLWRAPGTIGGSHQEACGSEMRTGSSFSLGMFVPGIGVLGIINEGQRGLPKHVCQRMERQEQS